MRMTFQRATTVQKQFEDSMLKDASPRSGPSPDPQPSYRCRRRGSPAQAILWRDCAHFAEPADPDQASRLEWVPLTRVSVGGDRVETPRR
ncbi:hypothetical protein [Pseudonocardia adelaidensis]|uniref:hypothetical protein n=1 Tax=Pseudonocardia adelaidensis TaxID=648754 RepID=UPI0031E54E97